MVLIKHEGHCSHNEVWFAHIFHESPVRFGDTPQTNEFLFEKFEDFGLKNSQLSKSSYQAPPAPTMDEGAVLMPAQQAQLAMQENVALRILVDTWMRSTFGDFDVDHHVAAVLELQTLCQVYTVTREVGRVNIVIRIHPQVEVLVCTDGAGVRHVNVSDFGSSEFCPGHYRFEHGVWTARSQASELSQVAAGRIDAASKVVCSWMGVPALPPLSAVVAL